MVITAISLLYLVNVASTGVQWLFLKRVFITDGATRETAFSTEVQVQFLQTLLTDIFILIVFVVADGLLIWRCYNVWGKSFRVIFLPLVLVVAEAALYLSIIIIACASNVDPSVNIQIILDKLTSSALFMTSGATLLTTALIAYQIYSVTRRDPRKGATKPYKDIAEVLVQSAAAYSLVTLLNALTDIIPVNDTNATALLYAGDYSGAPLLIIAGMAPTIMVARVAMQGSGQAEGARTAHLSGLEFRGDSRPSGNTSQILPRSIGARVGGRDDESSEGPRDAEKGGPTDVAVEGA
ncbi:hypothetical protein HYPSUDRAFT_206371 [Hypholoma sublateritium FD-334 SS-4]|uniref:Uncharacterized protein n=1 Tax=Hypholoma sublateritium (strain FD-334 SS-4) TaxID=945553 RepID=A0A0D2NDU7_HYPSF|nr:hypothetical protein HYPSUDRAFT_206371 [Hypholoma sublateritium FD-334 SS-4]